MKFVKVSKEVWKDTYSQHARMAVFGEQLDPAVERIDFAYLVADAKTDQLFIYCTFYEMDSTSLYLGFGGAFADSRGTGKTTTALKALFQHLSSLGYKAVNWHTKNTNVSMLRLGLRVDARIVGMSTTPTYVLLEHTVNLEKEI